MHLRLHHRMYLLIHCIRETLELKWIELSVVSRSVLLLLSQLCEMAGNTGTQQHDCLTLCGFHCFQESQAFCFASLCFQHSARLLPLFQWTQPRAKTHVFFVYSGNNSSVFVPCVNQYNLWIILLHPNMFACLMNWSQIFCLLLPKWFGHDKNTNLCSLS